MSQQKVFFAVPTYGSQPCVEFTLSALAVNDVLIKNSIETVWRFKGGDPYIAKARNTLASEFLTDYLDCTELFFWDDDVGAEDAAAAVLRIVRRPEDVIAGAYPKKNDLDEFPIELQFNRDTTPPSPIEQDGLYLASLAATGFMCIKRHVLERVAAESMRYDEQDYMRGSIKCWDMFRTGAVPNSRLVNNLDEYQAAFDEGYTQPMDPNDAGFPRWLVDPKNGKWWGEDYFFCAMVRHMGMEVWCDPDIMFSHRGSHKWEARFRHMLDEKIAAMSGLPRLAENTPAIKRWGSEASHLAAHVGMAFDKALAGNSELPEEVLALDGMSGRKYRMFINNLMREIDDPRYLEIGSYKGSTAIAAGFGVAVSSIDCIDNWRFFGGPRAEFVKNMETYVPNRFNTWDCDFRDVDYTIMPAANVFFYDGPHTEKDQYDAVRLVAPGLDDEYVLIVDDWNWDHVRSATFAGLKDSGQRILSAIEVRPVQRRTSLAGQNSDWYNGYLIAVVRKNEVAALAEAAE